MSNVGALLAGRSGDVGDGVYLERADPKEPALEAHLRALIARVPGVTPLARRGRDFAAATLAHEAQMQDMNDAELATAFRVPCQRMQRAGFTEPLTARAFAAVREAARR